MPHNILITDEWKGTLMHECKFFAIVGIIWKTQLKVYKAKPYIYFYFSAKTAKALLFFPSLRWPTCFWRITRTPRCHRSPNVTAVMSFSCGRGPTGLCGTRCPTGFVWPTASVRTITSFNPRSRDGGDNRVFLHC